MKRKRLVILGSTGSIGLSAIKVAQDIPERMEIVGLAANRQGTVLAEQTRTWKPKAIACYDTTQISSIQSQIPKEIPCYGGEEGLIQLATMPEADMVLVAIVGTAGLAPALAAIEAGKDLAVASKEILVMAGEAVMNAAKRKGVKILPVDSEHNAIFQCLQGDRQNQVKRLILTASGGPFRKTPAEEIENVTVEQALKHPTWSMGQKITIDSATLFNKGLEMIEAKWLFDVPIQKVDVVVHPQSIVHSLVEFEDGSQLAQLSHSDMCFPIQYAVTYPDRLTNRLRQLRLEEVGSLTFEAPDTNRFPSLNLARLAGEKGGTLPAVFNAANEVAVEKFLGRKIKFPQIWRSVEKVMLAHANIEHPSLNAIKQADAWAREEAEKVLG
jgi:1-deoxy-D-xylulose-5-phosphate reductoisomerase